MSIKLYNKRGKKNYKENKLIKELQPIIDKKIKDNPELSNSFKAADNYEELKSLHEKYAIEDAQFEEINNNDDMAKNQNEKEELVDVKNDNIFDDDTESDFIDPFNRQEPTTYDYTLEGGLQKDEVDPNREIRSDFAEPLSFDDAFELPSDDENEDPVDKSKSSKSNQQQKQEPKQKRERPEPINPSFDDMSGSQQKKSTKKFAKYIVEAVCALAEKGFVWYANKEINDSKLAEYEMNGEMNLSILVTLENGQEATVRRFFQQQCVAAEQLSKFEEEEKKDIAEALAEVFLEKGIAPSKTQELMIVLGGVLIKKGAILLSLKNQTNSLLDQLRTMNDGQPQQQQYEQPQQQYEQPQTQPEAVYQEPVTVEELQDELVADEDMLEIEQVVDTKE